MARILATLGPTWPEGWPPQRRGGQKACHHPPVIAESTSKRTQTRGLRTPGWPVALPTPRVGWTASRPTPPAAVSPGRLEVIQAITGGSWLVFKANSTQGWPGFRPTQVSGHSGTPSPASPDPRVARLPTPRVGWTTSRPTHPAAAVSPGRLEVFQAITGGSWLVFKANQTRGWPGFRPTGLPGAPGCPQPGLGRVARRYETQRQEYKLVA